MKGPFYDNNDYILSEHSSVDDKLILICPSIIMLHSLTTHFPIFCIKLLHYYHTIIFYIKIFCSLFQKNIFYTTRKLY